MPERRFRHAFIVTHGRSGSTLLQGLLNACDGVAILGENHGFHYYLYKARESVRLSREHVQGADPASPFFGADQADQAGIEAGVLELMRRQLHGHVAASGKRLVGFKEIRHDMPDLAAYLDFLRLAFADSLLIFLTRDLRETAASGFWRQGEPRLVEDKLRHMQAAFRDYADRHPECSHRLDYQDLIEVGPPLRALLERLELRLDDDVLEKVLATPHSHESTQVLFHDAAKIVRKPLGGREEDFALIHFEKQRMEVDSRLRFTGILLPKTAAVEAMYLSSPGGEEKIAVTTNLPTPGYAAKHPANPFARNCRFAVEATPRHAIYQLHVVQDGQDFILADVHLAHPLTRVFSD